MTSIKMNVKKLIVLGCIMIPLSWMTVSAAITKKNDKKTSSFYGSATLSSTDSSTNEKQINREGRLYAPPPDGGDPIGSDTPVEGHEITFFLWAFAGYIAYRLRTRTKTSTNN